MKSSYLIQRLIKPYKKQLEGKGRLLQELGNTFAFGGGLKDGGIPKEGMELIKDIFRFDYMGSAEFEFGAVPKALSIMGENFEKLVAFTIHTPFKHERWDKPTVKGIKQVHIICMKEHRDDVVKRIKIYAMNSYKNDTKEMVCLNESLALEELSNIAGWLELDNGYMFFTDKEMFEKTCKLFDVDEEKNA
jgi:hypothetical protein